MELSAFNSYDLLLIFITGLSVVLGFILGMFTKQQIFLKKRELEFKYLIEKEKQAKEQAEDAIRARDEFLAITSHELKTPLTTIILRIQNTLDSILNQSLASFSGEKLVESLSIAHQQTNRLQLLVKDLLNFSLITTGKLELDLKEADLVLIVKETLKRFEDQLALAGCAVKFDAQGEIKGLWDNVRMEQAVSNLLTNAVKYGQGAPIEIEVKKHGSSQATILVSDKGIGIDPQEQKIIFERFRRSAKNGNKYQGLGVGLFLVRQIIEAHGGKVSVKSKLGSGSRFIIELPIKKAPEVQQLPQPALPQQAAA